MSHAHTHRKETFTCEMCGRIFSGHSALKIHMTHTFVKQYFQISSMNPHN